jgi:arsenate reductase (thioredoxin)
MTSPSRVRVLFICIGNACRSPMAEAIARHEAADVIEPCSAGLYPLGCLAEPTISTLECNGYSRDGISSKAISRDAVRRADVIINLSGMSLDRLFGAGSSQLHANQQLENWDVPDPYGEDPATYQKILEELQRRVQRLANRLREEHRSAHT